MSKLNVLGDEITIMARPSVGMRGATVAEDITPPGGGPPLHRHHNEDELFYVVEGRIRIWRGEETFEAGPGDVALLPKGVQHSYRNIGEVPSRMIVTIIPAGFERFLEEMSERSLAVPDDIDAVVALAGTYNIEILGSPPETLG